MKNWNSHSIAGGNVKWHNHGGEPVCRFLKSINLDLLYDPAILSLAMYLLCSELCPLQNSYIEAGTPGPQNVTAFEDRALKGD